MMSKVHDGDAKRNIPWRLIGWAVPVLLLLLPLVTGAPWTLSDYVVMGALFGIAGLGIELAVRASGDIVYRAGAGVAVVTAFLLIWVNLAVGFLGDEGNPANLMFFIMLGVALVGAFLADFRAAGLARTMFATAVCQVGVGAVGLAAGFASPGNDGIYEVFMGTSLFAGLWLIAAWLFRKAARREGNAAHA